MPSVRTLAVASLLVGVVSEIQWLKISPPSFFPTCSAFCADSSGGGGLVCVASAFPANEIDADLLLNPDGSSSVLLSGSFFVLQDSPFTQ